MKLEEIQSILTLHRKWLYDEPGGERANLYNADLRNANLYNADLRNANLYNADLRNANLRNADLYNADLRNADLYNADLRNANLRNTNLYNADLAIAQTSIVPEAGAFVAWKKCALDRIVKLQIPADAKRSNATGRKCRANKATVLAIESLNGAETFKQAQSFHDQYFVYRVGEACEVDDFDEDRWNECAPGIHFYITRVEAAAHV